MSITEQILHLSSFKFWGVLLAATAASMAAFYYAFRFFVRMRIIEDTPTAKVRSAPQGYIELTGSAQLMAGDSLVAPLSGTPCCWYRFKIEKRGDKNWRLVESDTSDSLFLIEDATGLCHIDPEGADVTPRDKNVWYGYERYPQKNPSTHQKAQGGMAKLAKILNTGLSVGGRYRYTEEHIYDGDPLYVIGHFKTVDYEDQRQNQAEERRALLRQWKQDRTWLLQRFDLNRDGQIDPAEWDLARSAAKRQVELEHKALEKAPEINLLAAGKSNRHPFLMSTMPEFDLVKRYRWKAVGTLSLFFITGILAIWLLNNRFL